MRRVGLAYRLEALVKRLFKLAEAAGDDELMARFLVGFDRSVRRAAGERPHFESRDVETERETNALAASCRDRGSSRSACGGTGEDDTTSRADGPSRSSS